MAPGNKMTPNTTGYEWEIPVQGVPGAIPALKGIRCPMSYLSWYIGQMQKRPVVDRIPDNPSRDAAECVLRRQPV